MSAAADTINSFDDATKVRRAEHAHAADAECTCDGLQRELATFLEQEQSKARLQYAGIHCKKGIAMLTHLRRSLCFLDSRRSSINEFLERCNKTCGVQFNKSSLRRCVRRTSCIYLRALTCVCLFPAGLQERRRLLDYLCMPPLLQPLSPLLIRSPCQYR